MTKPCIGCKHYRRLYICLYTVKKGSVLDNINPDTGGPLFKTPELDAILARKETGHCGLLAKHYEPRERGYFLSMLDFFKCWFSA